MIALIFALTSISVTPTSASVAAGYTQQYTATGTYSNGTTQNLTSSATWSSSATSIATVSSGGLAIGVAQGGATITAKSGTISGSTVLTVTTPVLTSISISPTTASVAAGYTEQYTATGTYSNGTTQNLTGSATWSSSATSIAAVSSGGLATSVAQGSVTITATSGTISGSSLEGSNTDIADEFTKLIVTQQAYSANTKVITTANDMVQDLLNVLR